jgi:hypothetical protein
MFDLNAALRREFDQRRADFRAGVRLAMAPTGLENPLGMSLETPQTPVFCGFGGAQDAMLGVGCAGQHGALVGTGEQ